MGADLLNIGTSGLHAHKKSLETTGHNISNANTDGYSRKRTIHQANEPIASGRLAEGTGVKVAHIKRSHDKLIESQHNKSVNDYHYHKESTALLERVESALNEATDNGLNQSLNQFFNSFRELANQPENKSFRSILREKAKVLINDFKKIDQTITDLENYMGNKLMSNVEDINHLTESIAKLNKKITILEVNGGETGDLRDQRDLHIRNLAEFFDLKVYEDNMKQYVVHAENIGTVVVGGSVQKFKSDRAPEDRSTNNQSGSFEVFYENKLSSPLSNKFMKGRLGAIFKIRNQNLVHLKKQIDAMALHVAKSVNAIHRRGHAFKNIPISENGELRRETVQGPITGINFFEIPIDEKNTARYLDLNNFIKEDLNNVVSGLMINKPGDNRVAIAISKLQHEKILNGGTTTLEEEYLTTIGEMGLETRKSRLNEEQSQGLRAQMRAIKEKISGVSLDEETANMVKFQHAYQAAAKVIKTAEENFQTLIAMKR